METLEERLERFKAHEIETDELSDIVVHFSVWRAKVASGMEGAGFNIDAAEGNIMSDDSGLLKRITTDKKLDVLFSDMASEKIYELVPEENKLLINLEYLDELQSNGYLKTDFEGKEMLLISNTYRARQSTIF